MNAADGNDAVLLGALKDLDTFWARTAAVWKDSAREKFDTDCLQDLREAVRAGSNAIGQIEAVLRQVRRECT